MKRISYPDNLNFEGQVHQFFVCVGSDFALQNDYERFQASTVDNPAAYFHDGCHFYSIGSGKRNLNLHAKTMRKNTEKER